MVDAEDTDVAVMACYGSFKFEKELLLYRKKKILLASSFVQKIYHLSSYLYMQLLELMWSVVSMVIQKRSSTRN